MAKTLSLTDISGIGRVAANALLKSGIKTPQDLAKAKVKGISAVRGFGAIRAAVSKNAAKALLKSTAKAEKGRADTKEKFEKKGKKMAKKKKEKGKKKKKSGKKKKGKKKKKLLSQQIPGWEGVHSAFVHRHGQKSKGQAVHHPQWQKSG